MIRCAEFEIKTGGCLDAVDVTEDVEKIVADSGVQSGSALVFSPHTTCGVLIARNGVALAETLRELMSKIAPDGIYYAHDDLGIRTENLVEEEFPNARSHLLHVFAAGPSECIPIVDGRLAIGGDQKVFFVELDTSRPRRYVIQVLGQ